MNKGIDNRFSALLVSIIFLWTLAPALAQSVPPPAPSPIPPAPAARNHPSPRAERPPAFPAAVSERSIKVHPNVNVSIPCVSRGTVKVNGWNRSEVRVYVDRGNKFSFTVQEKSSSTGEPVWIKIAGADPRSRYGPSSECLWGEDIEIDVPVNATVSLKGHEITARIDSIRKVEIKTIGGNISLRNITGGVSAAAGQGDISVESSEGAIMLESTTGNILVFEVGPGEIGDVFKARTNSGAISLQGLDHRQVEVNSISGSVSYSGNIRSGGSYSLRTSRGSIRMSIPAASSSQISATYGHGNFLTDIPIKIVTENVSEGPIMSVVGSFGRGGDAMIKLISNSGSIAIRKL